MGVIFTRNKYRKVLQLNQQGVTFIELMAVVAIIALLSVLAVTQIDSVVEYRLTSDIRKFGNLWEYLYLHSSSRREGYRLVVDLDAQSYYVRREVPVKSDTSTQVDYLQNLRTKGEKERRTKKEEEDLLSLDQEFEEDDLRQAEGLETLFYESVFADPETSVRLARPLDLPSLADTQYFPSGLVFRDAKVGGKEVESGIVKFRFSPRGVAEFGVIHFQAGEAVWTLVLDPATGKVTTHDGDLEFESALEQKAN